MEMMNASEFKDASLTEPTSEKTPSRVFSRISTEVMKKCAQIHCRDKG